MFVYQDTAKIPSTNSRTIIFPHSCMDDGFDSEYYSQTLTNGRATPEDIKKVLMDVNKPRLSLKNRFKIFACGFFFLIALSFASLASLFIWDVPNDDMFIWYVSGGITALFAFMLTGIYVLFKYHCRCSIKCKEAAKVIINDWNETVYRKRGLRWVVPDAFPAWMELWKDYDEEDGTQSIFFIPRSPSPNKRRVQSLMRRPASEPLLSYYADSD